MKKIKDIMQKKIVALKEDTSVKDICKLLVKREASGLPVIDKNKVLIGFVSERDVILAVTKKDFFNFTAKKIMTKKVVCVSMSDPVTKASEIFSSKVYRRLPVVDAKNKLVGVVCRNDLISQLLGYYYQRIERGAFSVQDWNKALIVQGGQIEILITFHIDKKLKRYNPMR